MNTNLNNVTQVYSGKPGCMCGCRGKYSRSSTFSQREDEIEDVNDRSVKIIYNKVMNNPNVVIDECGRCAYVENDTRNLVVYFMD